MTMAESLQDIIAIIRSWFVRPNVDLWRTTPGCLEVHESLDLNHRSPRAYLRQAVSIVIVFSLGVQSEWNKRDRGLFHGCEKNIIFAADNRAQKISS